MTARTDSPSAAVRIRVMKRDRFQCAYCGIPGTDAELEIDHIIPVAKGGSHHISNLTTACRKCNQAKGDRSAPRKKTFVQDLIASAPKSEFISGNTNGAHPTSLIGLFLHTVSDKRAYEQGHIIGVDGDTVLVELFSWMDGRPTIVKPFERKYILSQDCRLYSSAEKMEEAFQIEQLFFKKSDELEAKKQRDAVLAKMGGEHGRA